jgi:hypothetical protein
MGGAEVLTIQHSSFFTDANDLCEICRLYCLPCRREQAERKANGGLKITLGKNTIYWADQEFNCKVCEANK